MALYYLLQDRNYSVEHLLTSINASYNRVSMHGLRRELLEQQVNALNLPHSTLELPQEPSMMEYEKQINQTVSQLHQQGFQYAAFGDIFLEDLKQYREKQLASLNIKTVFPIWKKDTTQLINEFIDLGFKAILICINAEVLDISFAGRIIDTDFLKDLPPGVDPCGENGEFHTFCYDGPIFKNPVSFKTGEKIYREYKTPATDQNVAVASPQKSHTGFWFCDLLAMEING